MHAGSHKSCPSLYKGQKNIEVPVYPYTIKRICILFSNAVVGESALDRLAVALGGKTMLPHILANVPPMLQNSKLTDESAIKA